MDQQISDPPPPYEPPYENWNDDDDYIDMYDDVDLDSSKDDQIDFKTTVALKNLVAEHGVKITSQSIHDWIKQKLGVADPDKYTFSAGTLTFGAFLYSILLWGDSFIDRLIAFIVQASEGLCTVLHAVGHGILVGVVFLLSFLFEWVFLTIQYCRGDFDENDRKRNSRIYWDRVKRSFASNFVATCASIAISAVLCVLTGGVACIIGIAVAIIAGCAAKIGVKWLWDKNRRMFFNALEIMNFLGT